MKSIFSYYNKLSLLALLVFVLLVILQSFWLSNAVKLQQQEMTLTLNQIIPDIALDINGMGHEYFHGDNTPIHELKIEEVEEIIQSYLDDAGIDHSTYFAIFKTDSSNLFLSNKAAFKNELIASEVKACMSCIVSFGMAKSLDRLPDESDKDFSKRLMQSASFSYYSPVKKLVDEKQSIMWLTLYQPHSFSNALKTMILLFGMNIILLLVLLFLFYHLLKLLSNYNKLTQLKEDFFNNMTHEFKTPLSSIRLASKVLRQSKNPEKAAGYFDLIDKESKTLEMQVDKLLELSLLDNQQLQLEKTNFDLHELINEIPDRLKPLLDAHDGRLIFDLKLENPKMYGDRNHISNSLCNLVENSLKYATAPVRIEIITQNKNGYNIIKVKDNGPGIQPEFQSQIFDRFYRAKKTNEYKNKGFGIGLSYVKTIVEAHEGSIKLNTACTEGCEIIIKLKS